jgi:hypothetical protein
MMPLKKQFPRIDVVVSIGLKEVAQSWVQSSRTKECQTLSFSEIAS